MIPPTEGPSKRQAQKGLPSSSRSSDYTKNRWIKQITNLPVSYTPNNCDASASTLSKPQMYSSNSRSPPLLLLEKLIKLCAFEQIIDDISISSMCSQ